MLEAASDPWSHRLSSPSAIHRQGVSIGVTGRVLLPLPLPQNGLASYENHSHNSVTPTPTKVKLCTEEFSTHSLCTPPQMCSFTAKARFVTMLKYFHLILSNILTYFFPWQWELSKQIFWMEKWSHFKVWSGSGGRRGGGEREGTGGGKG